MRDTHQVKRKFKVQIFTNSKFNWNKKFLAINSYLAEHADIVCDFELVDFDPSRAAVFNGYIIPYWFDTNVTSRADADVVCLHIDRKTWTGLRGKPNLFGRYHVDNDGVSEFYVIADERQWYTRGRRWDVFVHTFLHELSHALYSRGNQPLKPEHQDEIFVAGMDNTHHFDKVKKNIDLVWQDMNFLKEEKNTIRKILDSLKKSPTISQFAEAIKEFEGWFVPGTTGYPRGSLSYRNNNPGNLRWSPFESSNVNNFSVFKTYEDGWKALLHQIRLAVTGKSRVYKKTDTIAHFFEKYAPSSDNNHPATYANFVAKKIGVTPGFVVGNLRDQ